MTTELYVQLAQEMKTISEAHLRIVGLCEGLPREQLNELGRLFLPMAALGSAATQVLENIYRQANPEINDLINKAFNNEQTESSKGDHPQGE